MPDSFKESLADLLLKLVFKAVERKKSTKIVILLKIFSKILHEGVY